MTRTPQAEGTTPLITVDLWTDVVCPWCYIGEARLHEAIAAEGLTGQVRVRAHSFELDPTSPVGAEAAGGNIAHLVERKGLPEAQVREMEGRIQEMARELGRDFAVERPMANTRGIHRVLQALGESRGAETATAFFLDLQRDYFTGAADPFDAEVVIARAVAAGLAEDVARSAHSGASHDALVDAEVREAAEMGARGVPFFLFNDRYTAPGALPLESFREALRQIADEARAERRVTIAGGESCAADGTCD